MWFFHLFSITEIPIRLILDSPILESMSPNLTLLFHTAFWIFSLDLPSSLVIVSMFVLCCRWHSALFFINISLLLLPWVLFCLRVCTQAIAFAWKLFPRHSAVFWIQLTLHSQAAMSVEPPRKWLIMKLQHQTCSMLLNSCLEGDT